MPITSVTLTYDEVQAVIEKYLNATVFQTPYRVTRVDPWDWDADDQRQFAISVEPLAVVIDPVDAAIAALPVHPPANGNGHSHPVTVVTPAPAAAPEPAKEATQAAPAEAVKSRGGGAPKLTDAARADIVRLRNQHGLSAVAIAKQYGVSDSTIYVVLADARAAERGSVA